MCLAISKFMHFLYSQRNPLEIMEMFENNQDNYEMVQENVS